MLGERNFVEYGELKREIKWEGEFSCAILPLLSIRYGEYYKNHRVNINLQGQTGETKL